MLVLIAFGGRSTVNAFDLSTYADVSALASGKWIKVSVRNSGMHFIPVNDLKKWGFSDVSKVRVHGYGGARISDVLSLKNYIDDLPQIQCRFTDEGIYFYAIGPESWSVDNKGRHTHALNPFSNRGYYFLTESDGDSRAITREGLEAGEGKYLNEFTEHIMHESDISALTESGHLLVGEDFKYTGSRQFVFNLPGLVGGTDVWMQCRFVSRSLSGGKLTFETNGSALPSSESDIIAATTKGLTAVTTSTEKTFTQSSDVLKLNINYTPAGTVESANIDALDLNYRRKISLAQSSSICFYAESPYVMLSDAPDNAEIWDVTDPLNVVAMQTAKSDAAMKWVNVNSGRRHYAAWTPGSSLYRPEYAGIVTNQNLHDPTASPDMVIFTPSEFIAEAYRIASFHSRDNEGLDVMVVDQESVFNEFSSGSRDVGAFRRMLKMLYDRGNASGKTLKYVLMLGRPTFDNRNITAAMKALAEPYMPTWQTDESLRESDSYTTDDILAFLDDDSGLRLGSDRLCVAVGRIPVRNSRQAKAYVDKLYGYSKLPYGSWKNKVIALADDGDKGEHMEQSDRHIDILQSTTMGRNMMCDKIYLDAYDLTAGICVGAREKLHRKLNEGAVWWTYIGHASKSYITGQNVMNHTDISQLYLKRYPIFYGSTCSFLQWDGAEMSGGERLCFLENGGAIAAISATRTVFISENKLLSEAMAHEMFDVDEQGMPRPIGEIYRRAKNRLTMQNGQNNTNKLRYVLLGDPAMRMAVPAEHISLEFINSTPIGSDDATLMARQTATMRGSIYDRSGAKDTSFNGIFEANLYDAERTITTLGRNIDNTEGRVYNFEEQGDRLLAGRDSIRNGEFELRITMPTEIADNYRPAAFDMYAYDATGKQEAIGLCRDFYVYGYDSSASNDTLPPIIHSCYLNHESFVNGDAVDSAPMFIANVSDDTGINLSMSGIGHQMSISVDGRNTYYDVATYFTPSITSPHGGTVAYKMPSMSPGNHSLEYKVWDTSGNSSSAALTFNVVDGLAPTIYAVYTDSNPASTETNFYISHNRPDAMLTITVTVYDISGKMIWTSTVTDKSDMFSSTPIKWDLCNMGGHRVSRGIYPYQVSIMSANGNAQAKASGKIAVTGH